MECLIPVLMCFLKHASEAGDIASLTDSDFKGEGDGVVIHRKLVAGLETLSCLFQVSHICFKPSIVLPSFASLFACAITYPAGSDMCKCHPIL